MPDHYRDELDELDLELAYRSALTTIHRARRPEWARPPSDPGTGLARNRYIPGLAALETERALVLPPTTPPASPPSAPRTESAIRLRRRAVRRRAWELVESRPDFDGRQWPDAADMAAAAAQVAEEAADG